jgi:hypothetical protein
MAGTRTVLGRLAPRPIKSWHQRWREHRLLRRVARVNARYRERHPAVVSSGPFAGVRYPDELIQVPKLVGTYELELQPALERLIARQPATIVNVGAGEGYYAVGLARRLPHAQVHAFDIDDEAQRLCRSLAVMNEVADRVTVRGECSPAVLADLAGADVALVMDCEGCELALLRPDESPTLRDWTIIVELHDFLDPATSTIITERFADTHDVDLIEARSRRGLVVEQIDFLSAAEQEIALEEARPPGMRWADMRPRSAGGVV